MSDITYHYSPNGKVSFGNMNSALSALPGFMTVTLSSSQAFAGEKCIYNYPTDEEGLNQLAYQACQILESIHEYISSISVVMGSIDIHEFECEHRSLSWLIAGLSELAGMVSFQHGELRSALSHQREKISDKELITAICNKASYLNEASALLKSDSTSTEKLSSVLKDAEDIVMLARKILNSHAK